MDSLKENLLTNQQHVLVCIQYEMIRGGTVFEAYENFCKILGENVMKYQEFDFWYHRFKNGQMEVDYDRKNESPTRELSDFPIHVVEKIVEKMEWKEKCIFRNVSKKCREIVDSKPIVINKVDLLCKKHTTRLMINEESVEFCVELEHETIYRLMVNGVEESKISLGGYVLKEMMTYYNEEQKEDVRHFENIVKMDRAEKQVVRKLAIAFHNPQLRIEHFKVSLDETAWLLDLIELLESLKHQIHVECFEFEGTGAFYAENDISEDVLCHLKPGVLQTIILKSDEICGNSITSMTELEQWKQAKKLNTNFVFKNMDEIAHFDRLDANVVKNFTSENVVNLKNIYVNSPTFEVCVMRLGKWNVEEIRGKLGGDRLPMADGSTLHVEVTRRKIVFKRIPKE